MAAAGPMLGRLTAGGDPDPPAPDPDAADVEIVGRVLGCHRVSFTTTQPQGVKLALLDYMAAGAGYQGAFPVTDHAWRSLVQLCRDYDKAGLRISRSAGPALSGRWRFW